MNSPIAFIDLASQQKRIREGVEARLKAILDSGAYILGPDVAELEQKLSAFAELEHTLGCASGTDALLLPLMAWEFGPGDAIFVPSFTFAATAEVAALVGATPVFVDVLPDTFNIDPEGLERAILQVQAEGKLTPRAIIAVDLFGQIADYPALRKIADKHGLKLVADAAQGYGSTLNGQQAGKFADVLSTSFYPAKPLGCYGDGGAVQTDDKELASIMRSLSVHGQGIDKYDNLRIGITGRLDTFQAAVLLEKLPLFAEEIATRQAIAARYTSTLSDIVTPQRLPDGVVSTWAQYTIRVPGGHRDAFMAHMREAGVPTVIYYGKPLHLQTAYRAFPVESGQLPVSEALSKEVVSLPMHPYLDEPTQNRIIDAARNAMTRLLAA
ncbi:DegT/DnrJ/EryC1/StrS aminotransferase family protein [Aureimonas fodinaquatilis]|uniref:DegT/DnrJ/EryC1/StrS aminotransferase family protein n=1 Tax=Aureimonas fodinaquatilis TaxID=2565783 RepID=A0A5B0DUS4_9HYPH|nr:DegT/DnrJ/EryC1/StrS aminotransferase family protein [Aureimonas fodinaquatilis]KAA0970193.1 DegT/DnrJ/EryC1/StrS aminotransferase family protein [Aureimonas fodinaquatilis]